MPPALSRAARGVEHEAAGAQAARVHVGRPARLRRDRHPEPARVRPGLLRQGRRRPRRREADRRPLQGPGLRARARARAAGGDRRPGRRRPRPSACRRPRRSSTSAIPTTGWTLLVWARDHGRRSRPSSPVGSGSSPTRSRAPTRRSSAGGWRPNTCTPPRSCCSGRLACRPAADMCGIAGIVRHGRRRSPVDEATLLRMARAIRHRGPDGFGLALDPGAGLVSTRLAIIDLPGGWQPLEADATVGALVYNGEVYNHPELRAELEARGEAFETSCDTEVVLRLLERDGLDALERLNGQFAFAWWQPRARRLTLVRDRFGVRPLHYALLTDGSLVFGSEAKALFASGAVGAERRPGGARRGLHALGPASPARPRFAACTRCRPAGSLVWERGEIVAERRWWDPDYPDRAEPRSERSRGAAARQRPAAPARRRAGRHLPLGRARLEPDHRARAAGDRGRAADLLGRLPRPALRRAGRTRRRSRRAIGTRHHVVEIGRRGDRRRASRRWSGTPRRRWCAPRRCRCTCSPARSATHGITVSPPARAPTSSSGATTCSRRSPCASSAETDPERAAELLDRLYAYLGAGAARRGPAWRRFLLETGAADDPLGSHLTRAGATAGGQGVLPPRRRRELSGSSTRSTGCAPSCRRRSSEWSRARARGVARGDDAARALPAVRSGRSGGDGPRRRGPLPVSRPPGVRLCAPSCRPRTSSTACDDKVALRRVAERRAAAGDREARQAALSSSRGRSVLRCRGAGVGRGGAFAAGARRHRDLGSAARRGSLAPLPRRPRDRRARGDGLRRGSLDPALAPAFIDSRTARLPDETAAAAGEDRPDSTRS